MKLTEHDYALFVGKNIENSRYKVPSRI